jgi:hypothetical protein
MTFDEEPIRVVKRSLDDMSIQDLKERIEDTEGRNRRLRTDDREEGSDAEGGRSGVFQVVKTGLEPRRWGKAPLPHNSARVLRDTSSNHGVTDIRLGQGLRQRLLRRMGCILRD